MDHKVSKDMISSGMIPSGEKTQADLGRIQYGSAPSPSSLMDAYKSIYEHHQKDKDGNTIPHEGEDIQEVLGVVKAGQAAKVNRAMAARRTMGAAKMGAKKTAAVRDSMKPKAKPTAPAPQGSSSSLMGTVSRGLSSAASAAGRADKAIAARGGLKKMGTDYLKKNKSNIKGALLGKTAAGTAARIGGAYVAGRMMGGEKKDSGGYYYQNLDFGYTPEGDTISEDLFDALKFLLTEEGYDEKTTMKTIASMDTDFINESLSEENLDEALPLLALAPLLAKGAVAAKAGLAAAKASKIGMAAVKGAKALSTAGKAFGKGLMTPGLKGASASKITPSGGKLSTAATKVGKAQKAGQMVRGAGAAMKNNPMNTALVAASAPGMIPQGAPKPEAAQRAVTSGKRTAGMRTMSLDLFDVVKGKLLDEGLTEEEVLDVMTTLTLDEIQEGMGKMKLLPTAALLGGTAVATQQIASKMGEKSGEESIKPDIPKKPGLIQKLKDRTSATNKAIEKM